MLRAFLKWSALLVYSPLFLNMTASLRCTSLDLAKEGASIKTLCNISIDLRERERF